MDYSLIMLEELQKLENLSEDYKGELKFLKYLTPMLKNGVLKMTIPEKPSSKNQKYFS